MFQGFIGSLDHASFMGLSDTNCSFHMESIPGILFASFEMALAVVAPFMAMSAW